MAKNKKKKKIKAQRRPNRRGAGTRVPAQITAAIHQAQGVLAIYEMARAWEREVAMCRIVIDRLGKRDPEFLEAFNREFYKLAKEEGLESELEGTEALEAARASEPPPAVEELGNGDLVIVDELQDSVEIPDELED